MKTGAVSAGIDLGQKANEQTGGQVEPGLPVRDADFVQDQGSPRNLHENE
jgi:hypothetical protein